MKTTELKKILKPLIKECIKEVLFEEDGALSHIIAEVATGLSANSHREVVTEQNHLEQRKTNTKQNFSNYNSEKSVKEALNQKKKRLLDAIGQDAYGGVNLFEGTTPAPASVDNSSPQGALSGVSPNDPGVDISSLFSNKSSAIFNRMMEKK